MGKAKTSRKPKASYPLGMKPLKVPSLKNVETHSPSEWLADAKNIKGAIMECLQDNDYESLKEILKAHYEAMEYQNALKAAKVPRRTFHHALSDEGNPTAKTLISLISGVLKTAQIAGSRNSEIGDSGEPDCGKS